MMLGTGKTQGYWSAVRRYQRTGEPLSPQLCRALRASIERAAAHLGEVQAAVDESQAMHADRRKAKPRRKKASSSRATNKNTNHH